MILALAARAHDAPAFNGLFFATAATIIPVLFLALAVQGNAYQALLNAFSTLSRISLGTGPWQQRHAAAAGVFALLVVAPGLVLIGAASEVASVYALYQQQASTGTAALALAGVVTMVVAAAAVPALTFFRTYAAAMAINWRRTRALWSGTPGSDSAAEQQQDASGTAAAAPPEPAPGSSEPEPG